MAQLAIKGHATRGREVIEILGILGGSNAFEHIGNNTRAIYYINEMYNNFITCSETINVCDYIIFTLEQFLEKYPYKVGDKVSVYEYESKVRIDDMKWDGFEIQYSVFTDETEWYSAAELNELNKCNKPYKEETMDRKYNVEEYLKVWEETEKVLQIVVNDRFELKEDNGKFYIIKKQPQYPTTYKECCHILNIPTEQSPIMSYNGHLLEKFQQLLICRDAYWQIAGGWKPSNAEICYSLYRSRNEISKNELDCYGNTMFLEFPTEEMRDAFFENFKKLIESCDELL